MGSNNSADRNSTSTSSASATHTSPALHSTKLAYLGESKSPGSVKQTSSALHSTKLAHLGHGHHGVRSPSLQTTGTLTTGSRLIDQSGAAKSEFTPFIFPFGPG